MRCSSFSALQAALAHGALVVLADRGDAALQRLGLGLEDRHRDAGVEEVHADAAAHGAGADDADLADLAHRRVLGHVGDLGRGALAEEDVAQRARLRRSASAARKPSRSTAMPSSKRLVGRGLDRVDAAQRRRVVLRHRADRGAREGEEGGGVLVADLEVAHARMRRRSAAARSRAKATAPASRSPSMIVEQLLARHLGQQSLVTGLPDTIMLSAGSRPSARGRRCVPPAPGRRPSLTSGSATCVPGAATR